MKNRIKNTAPPSVAKAMALAPARPFRATEKGGLLRSPFSLSLLLPLLLLLSLTTNRLSAQRVHACVVMPPPAGLSLPGGGLSPQLPPGVQKAVALGNSENRSSSYFWSTGSTLRVKFLGGSEYVRQQVRRYASEWSRYANINFHFVTGGNSDIRVSFVRNGSSWSMLGSQARAASENRATMNFGWFTDATPDYEFRRTVLHEFGHALGLLHEHQNPSGGIPWNEEAVYDFYRRTQGWGRQTTYQNVIARQRHDETQYSSYDPVSIMHYPVSPELTLGGYEVGINTAISPTDARFIARMYPGRTSRPPVTEPTKPAPSRPAPPKPRPTAERPEPAPERPERVFHEVIISNQLGPNQRAEVIELFMGGQKFTFRLNDGERGPKVMRFSMEAGTYDYRVQSTSVYRIRKRVWDGRRYVERYRDHTVYGDGTGKLTVNRNDSMIFYGNYDRNTGRMRVSLGSGGESTAKR